MSRLRMYGRVHAHGGEHAETLFAHASYLPLVPRGSFWITSDDGKHVTGFPIALCRRSLAAAYLRWWGPVVAVLALAAPLEIGIPIAAIACTLVAWSWTWRALRGELALRRSDWNLCAYNTRCDPPLISSDDRLRLHARLTGYWRKHGFLRTPAQVARYGPTGVAEALLAYGLLRLADAGALADRLVLARHEPAGAIRVVEVSADIADAASAWHRRAPVDRDDLHTRDWADLLSSDDAFAAAIAEARHASARLGRAREAIELAHGRARDLLTSSVLLAVAAVVFAAIAWLSDSASDRTSLVIAAVAAAVAANAVLAIGLRAMRRADAALEALAAANAQLTN